jgi:hypothetical protein
MFQQSFLLVLTCGALPAAAADAQPPPQPRTLADFVSESDLVFHGTVVEIEYAPSAPVKGEPRGIPHTFVTYQVEGVLHGSADGEEVTLRFLGGLEADGTYSTVSVTPQFDIGDQDVLFVRGNGESGCPLVADSRGRLRIIAGQVYTDTGRAVALDAEGTILPGQRHALEEVATTTVNGETFVTAHDPEAIAGPSDAIGQGALLHLLAMEAAAAPMPAVTFESADPGIPFVVPPFTPVELRDSRGAAERLNQREVDGSAAND